MAQRCFRIPGWCKRYDLKQNGKAVTAKAENGYVGIECKSER
jgi:uncharacterized protein